MFEYFIFKICKHISVSGETVYATLVRDNKNMGFIVLFSTLHLYTTVPSNRSEVQAHLPHSGMMLSNSCIFSKFSRCKLCWNLLLVPVGFTPCKNNFRVQKTAKQLKVVNRGKINYEI